MFDLTDFSASCHANGVLVVAATDLLASAIAKPVGEMGADIVVGSAQRFGVPLVPLTSLPLFFSILDIFSS